MTSAPDPNANIPALLRAWARVVREHLFTSQVIPWWRDPAARLQSIAEATEALGWQVQTGLDEEWDMHLTTPARRLAIRCVGAGVAIGPEGDGRDVIADAWRVMDLTPQPSRGTLGVGVVAVMPHIAQPADGASARSALAAWWAAQPWPRDGMSVLADAVAPMPCNSVGMAFPGIGLTARIIHGS